MDSARTLRRGRPADRSRRGDRLRPGADAWSTSATATRSRPPAPRSSSAAATTWTSTTRSSTGSGGARRRPCRSPRSTSLVPASPEQRRPRRGANPSRPIGRAGAPRPSPMAPTPSGDEADDRPSTADHRARCVQRGRGAAPQGIRPDDAGRAARGGAAHRPARAAVRDAADTALGARTATAGRCAPRAMFRRNLATGGDPSSGSGGGRLGGRGRWS